MLPGSPYPLANGALWTIPFEFRCYLLVALGGVSGILRRRGVWLGAAAAALLCMGAPALTDAIPWSGHLTPFLGTPTQDARMVSAFLVGSCFYLFREAVVFRGVYVLLAASALIAAGMFAPGYFEMVLIVAGGYLMFHAAQSRAASRIQLKGLPDISYGVYLYGWPVESLLIYRYHASPWATFAAAALITIPLGWLSWHFVERPMLQFKGRKSAALPAA